jgi:hypothetical protein
MARGTVQQAEAMIRDGLASRGTWGFGYGFSPDSGPIAGCALCALYLGAGGEEEDRFGRCPRAVDGYVSTGIFDFLTSEALDAPFDIQNLIDLEGGYENLAVGAVHHATLNLPVQESDFYRLGEKLRLERLNVEVA